MIKVIYYYDRDNHPIEELPEHSRCANYVIGRHLIEEIKSKFKKVFYFNFIYKVIYSIQCLLIPNILHFDENCIFSIHRPIIKKNIVYQVTSGIKELIDTIFLLEECLRYCILASKVYNKRGFKRSLWNRITFFCVVLCTSL